MTNNRIRRNNVEGDIVAMYAPRRVQVPSDPPTTESTIRVQKLLQFNFQVAAAGANLTVANVAAAIPGGTTYWNSIRIQKLQFWGPDYNAIETLTPGVPSMTVTVPSNSSWSQPPMQFADSGTGGQKRATIGYKLGLLDQARFFGPADTTTLATIKVNSTSTAAVVVQVSVELVSPVPT